MQNYGIKFSKLLRDRKHPFDLERKGEYKPSYREGIPLEAARGEREAFSKYHKRLATSKKQLQKRIKFGIPFYISWQYVAIKDSMGVTVSKELKTYPPFKGAKPRAKTSSFRFIAEGLIKAVADNNDKKVASLLKLADRLHPGFCCRDEKNRFICFSDTYGSELHERMLNILFTKYVNTWRKETVKTLLGLHHFTTMK